MSIIDQNTTATSEVSVHSAGNIGVGQSITGDGNALNTVTFRLRKSGAPTGNIVAKVYDHTGTFGTSSVPTGAALATSGNLDIETLTTSFNDYILTFSTPATLTDATYYVVTVEYGGGDASNTLRVAVHNSTVHGGNYSSKWYATGNWGAQATYDTYFIAESALGFKDFSGTAALVTDAPNCVISLDGEAEYKDFYGTAAIETLTSGIGPGITDIGPYEFPESGSPDILNYTGFSGTAALSTGTSTPNLLLDESLQDFSGTAALTTATPDCAIICANSFYGQANLIVVTATLGLRMAGETQGHMQEVPQRKTTKVKQMEKTVLRLIGENADNPDVFY